MGAQLFLRGGLQSMNAESVDAYELCDVKKPSTVDHLRSEHGD